MKIFYNSDQEKLYKLVKKHGSWSPAELLRHKDVQKFIGYIKKDHMKFRHRLAGRIQFLKGRLKKFDLEL